MRVLVTTQPAASQLRAVVPAAQAFRRRGHEVLVAAPRTQHADAASYGLEAVEVSLDWAGQASPFSKQAGAAPHHHSAASIATQNWARMLSEMVMGERVLRRARDLISIAEGWRPDLVLRDSAELGGCLAGEALGIPHVSVQS